MELTQWDSGVGKTNNPPPPKKKWYSNSHDILGTFCHLKKLRCKDGHDVVCLRAPLHAAAFRIGQHLVPEARLVQTKKVDDTSLHKTRTS